MSAPRFVWVVKRGDKYFGYGFSLGDFDGAHRYKTDRAATIALDCTMGGRVVRIRITSPAETRAAARAEAFAEAIAACRSVEAVGIMRSLEATYTARGAESCRNAIARLVAVKL